MMILDSGLLFWATLYTLCLGPKSQLLQIVALVLVLAQFTGLQLSLLKAFRLFIYFPFALVCCASFLFY